MKEPTLEEIQEKLRQKRLERGDLRVELQNLDEEEGVRLDSIRESISGVPELDGTDLQGTFNEPRPQTTGENQTRVYNETMPEGIPGGIPPNRDRDLNLDMPRPDASTRNLDDTTPPFEDQNQTPRGPMFDPENPPEEDQRGSTSPEIGQLLAEEATKGRFRKMFEGTKKILGKTSETLGVSKVVDRLGIAYNQSRADRHERKAVDFKEKMSGIDMQVKTLEEAMRDLHSVIEPNTPGSTALELKIKVIDAQKAELLTKKDKVQSKLEKRINKNKIFINQRDAIASKVIAGYETKLAPMEEKLGVLNTKKDEVDLLATATEIRHKNLLTELGGIEKRKQKIEESLRKTGMSERQIRNFEGVEHLADIIKKGKEKIAKEKADMEKRTTAIDKKVAKADAKANPYRDKREKFVKIKEKRPINIEAPERVRGVERTEREEVSSNQRREVPPTQERQERRDIFETPSYSQENTTETINQEPTLYDLIDLCNMRLRELYDTEADNQIIDGFDFLRATKLYRTTRMDFKDFKKLLEKYFKARKKPNDKFRKATLEFLDQTIAS